MSARYIEERIIIPHFFGYMWNDNYHAPDLSDIAAAIDLNVLLPLETFLKEGVSMSDLQHVKHLIFSNLVGGIYILVLKPSVQIL